MQFSEVVQQLIDTAKVGHAQDAIRTRHGRASSRWVAETAGISPRTARRWLSRAYPPSRAKNILELVPALSVAAHRIRSATLISVGTVEVAYNDIPQGTRSIGDIPVHSKVSTYLVVCADDLDNADAESAADAFSNAVMHGYEAGLEDTLTVLDYLDGVELSE